jgi:predicted porin
VINLGAAYMVNCDFTLTGGVEYTSNKNVVTNTPAPAGAVLPYDLGQWGAVKVDTLRLTAGADYRLTQNINCYGRYNYYDFDNGGWGYQSGTANMILAGLSGVY